ncbi:MAG: PA domain-containing protein [Actinomycetota bacterium]
MLGALAVMVGASALPSATATAASGSSSLRDAVTVANILRHERALQSIADRNDDTRASGTSGYDASSDYVAGKLRSAGYRVDVQEFDFRFFDETAAPVFERVQPSQRTYVEDEDFATMTYSGSGDVTADLQSVNDNLIPPPAQSGSTAGCEAADFEGFTPGNVALIQRGTCTFAQKAENAETAGASGVVIFNEGQEGRTGVVAGTPERTPTSRYRSWGRASPSGRSSTTSTRARMSSCDCSPRPSSRSGPRPTS